MEFNIKLSLYFEIKDAAVFGGKGSIGYSETAVEISHLNYEKDNLFNKKEIMESYIDAQTKSMAGFSKVPVECVRVISKEEYDANTDEED